LSAPNSFRYARLLHIRWFIAVPELIALLGLASNYLARGAQSAATQPLVAAFDVVPYLWPMVFTVPSIGLLAALIAKRYIAQAYVLAAVAFWLYGIALILGAVFAGSSWAAASLSMAMVTACLVLGMTYSKGR
jgi:hypothetical protein